MTNPYGLTFVYRCVDGGYSRRYKTYLGCFKAARKLYPYDTDRMIYKVRDGLLNPVYDPYLAWYSQPDSERTNDK